MNKYTILDKQEYHFGNYSLVPIRMEDRYDIMKWRNEQIYHLRQSKPLTKETQDNYFNNVIKNLFTNDKPEQLLFSYLEGNRCIGYGGLVHINWIDNNAEISFIMDTELENNNFKKYWEIFLDLLRPIAFRKLNLHKIYTYAFDIRPNLYEAIEKKGFVKEAVLKEHCLINDEYKDVIIHSLINNSLDLREMSQEDKKLTFEWANEEKTRENSFNSTPIPFEDHSIWFDKKLIDENAWYFICELNGEPAGLIRFDIKGNKIITGITIDQKYRGRKISSKLLRKGCEIVSNRTFLPIVAYIKKSNIPSIKSFEKAGFIHMTNLKINDIDTYEYIYNKQ